MQPNTSLTIGRNRRDFIELDKDDISRWRATTTRHASSAGVDERIDAHRSFRDAHLTLTEEQVKIETARCLGCGASCGGPQQVHRLRRLHHQVRV